MTAPFGPIGGRGVLVSVSVLCIRLQMLFHRLT